jgi:hypothetical protein
VIQGHRWSLALKWLDEQGTKSALVESASGEHPLCLGNKRQFLSEKLINKKIMTLT